MMKRMLGRSAAIPKAAMARDAVVRRSFIESINEMGEKS
jgi:hypothetical protein